MDDAALGEWDARWSWESMCGPEGLEVWSPLHSDMGLCFQILCLQVPVLVLLALTSSFYCGRQDRWIEREHSTQKWLQCRATISLLLALVPVLKICIVVGTATRGLHPVHYLFAGIEIITWVIHFGYILTLRNQLGLSPRGPVIICFLWTIEVVLTVVSVRSYARILRQGDKSSVTQAFYYSAIATVCLQAVYLVTFVSGRNGRRVPPRNNGFAADEQQALLGPSCLTYSRFREDQDPEYLGVAMDDSTIFARLFFYWVMPLMARGIECRLTHSDNLFELPIHLTPAYISARMESILDNKPAATRTQSTTRRVGYGSTMPLPDVTVVPAVEVVTPRKRVSLLRALHRCFGWHFYGLGLLKLTADTARFVSPLLLNSLVTFIETRSDATEDGYFLVAGLTLAALTYAICHAHFSFQMSVVGIKLRMAMVTLIYKKTLSVSALKLKAFSVGEIVNFMSVDTDRIVNSCPSFHELWSIPMQLGVVLYLLYREVGISFLAGVFFAVILIPINKYIAIKIGSFNAKMLKKKDSRVKLMSEILRGVRTLKLHVWEEYFMEKVMKVRTEEVKYLKKLKYLDALCVYFWATTPVIISVLTISTCVLLGNEMTAAKVATTIALLNMLILPLNAFPWVLNGMVNAWVSLKRIEKLVKLPDQDLESYFSELPADSANIVMLMKDGSFSWGSPDIPNLKDVTITIVKGQLIGVVGEIGSGKTSLLRAFIGELEKISGVVALSNYESGVAYVSQEPWLQRGTIRDNILFGKLYDRSKYKAVLEACCLDRDLERMPEGDLSGVAEGASNLSGGQKARIALARAVYQDKSIYLLDDVLSAVDPPVAHHIFYNCINGILRDRTRILCTHHTSFLIAADAVIRMSNGYVLQYGPPCDVIIDELQESLALSDSEATDNENYGTEEARGDNANLDPSVGVLNKEEMLTGSVRTGVYFAYWKAMGHLVAILVLLSAIAMQVSRNATDLWAVFWTSPTDTGNATVYSDGSLPAVSPAVVPATPAPPINGDVRRFLIVYGSIGILNSVFSLTRAFSFAFAGIRAATRLHVAVVHNLLRARVTFFDLSPMGRILNRISSDSYTIDDSLPFMVNILLASSLGLCGTLVVMMWGQPYLVMVFVPLIPLYYWLQNHYRYTSRELKRLSSITLSPLYSHFSETVFGLTSIHAFKVQQRFRSGNEQHLEENQKVTLASSAASQWLGIRLQMIGVALLTGVGLIAVIQHQYSSADAAFVGLALAYALGVTGSIGTVLSTMTEVEREMIAVERTQFYIDYIPIEVDRDFSIDNPPYAWPFQGVVAFRNVLLRYREDLEASLKGVSFETRPAEKIGVVGRTGAGKSSLLSALFRTVEISVGQILIDGVDISQISLRSLRSKLSVIPQDPFVFSGTVRENLDPLGKHSDRELYEALSRCQLHETIRRMGGLDATLDFGGEPLSTGQRQLMCLTRAVLSKAKILCIDEATANVDYETDRLIQKTIRECFRQSTVITIAHRIDTIMDSDRVLTVRDGMICEFDSPSALIDNVDSYFYSLYAFERSEKKKRSS